MSKPKSAKAFNARPYMELAIAEMNKSKNEPRPDGKVPPKVGAVLVFPDGKVIQAHRGELRDGDHAEYSLLERKLGHEKLEECVLFTTLEPCVERNAPKVPCCRRTTNARIKTVYVGIVDPDPTVSTKGITHLERHGARVIMFDRDLQEIIEKENADFLAQALERKRKAEEVDEFTTELEQPITAISIEEFSTEALQKFIQQAKLDFKIGQPAFQTYLRHLGVLALDKETNTYKPNGVGILLFGKNPRLWFKQAALKCTAQVQGYELKPESFEQALVLIPEKVEEWLKTAIGQKKNTESFQRKDVPTFPIEVLREAVINALVHRDYTIEGAKSSIKVDNDSIVIKSPGAPPASISLEQLNTFRAPSISRNPILTYVFNLMGYVEETGLGMAALLSLYEKYGLPLPEYTYKEPFLTLTFPRDIESVQKVTRIKGVEELTSEELLGYEWIKSQKEVSAKEYAEQLGIASRTASRHLKRMLELDVITTNNELAKSPKLRYKLT